MERLPGGPCSLSLPCPMAKLAGIFFNRPDELEERGRRRREGGSDRRKARGTAAAADNFSGSHGSQTTSSNDKSRGRDEREGGELKVE